MARRAMRRARGFTMVELIVVMVLLGIVAAVGVPKLMGSNSFAPLALRDEIESGLRYAQKTAVGHRRLVCAAQPNPSSIVFSIASDRAAIVCNTALGNPINIGVLGSTRPTYSGNITAPVLFFQPDGTITKDGAGVTPAAGNIIITTEGTAYTIRIDGATGYVD